MTEKFDFRSGVGVGLWRRWTMVSILVLISVLAITATHLAQAAAVKPYHGSAVSIQVTVNTQQSSGTVPATAFGVNNAVWDGNLLDSNVPQLLQNDGVKVMRYPGGSTADTYHWQTNTIEPNNTNAGPVDFDTFMGVVQKTRAQAMVTVNYGSGTPQEAASWVQYANVTNHYGVKYWEIGNEIYGNGTYGADWEYDLHPKGATTYAHNALQFIQAMKAVDPSIKIGVVLTSPGDWPDGIVGQGDTMDWNHTVLSVLGPYIDFVDVHWYTDNNNPGSETDAGLLANPSSIPGKVATLRSLISEYSGSNAGNVQIMVTETNSVAYNPGKQTVSLVNALFLDEDYMNWLENGVVNVDWWDTHNGIVTYGNNSPSLYGNTQYGDYGMLSNGTSSNGLSEPPAETPFPAYYGLQMLHILAFPGNQMVGATSNQGLVAAYAVSRGHGILSILLINEDPTNSYGVNLSYGSYRPLPGALVSFYGENSTSISTKLEPGMPSTSYQVIPPYSLTVITLASKQ
jgi:hypothetical protein